MKPNFALSLSFEGIRLLHRSGTGWTVVGEVALDSPDLAGELAVLRKTALALDPAGLRTKIVLPNDQIRYLALDTTRASEEEIRKVLSDATPYGLDELAWDVVRGGGRTYIAAVARETLEEAESFAAEHRFGPVSFAAVPEEFSFIGEPFFGQTRVASALLPPGETVERDAVVLRVSHPGARPPRAEAAPQAAAEPRVADGADKADGTPAPPAPPPAAPPPAAPPPAVPPAALAPVPGGSAAQDRQDSAAPVPPAEARDPAPAEALPAAAAEAEAEAEEPTVVFASRSRTGRKAGTAAVPAAPPQSPAGAEPAGKATTAAPEDAAPPPAAGATAQEEAGGPVFGRRAAVAPPVAGVAPATRPVAPVRPPPDTPPPPPGAAPLVAEPPPAGRSGEGPRVVPFAPPRAPAPAALAQPDPGARIARFPVAPKPGAAAPGAAPAAARQAGGKPRFLLLILIAILVLVMLVAALWLGRTDNVVSRLFGGGAESAEVVTAEPVALPRGPGGPADGAGTVPVAAATPEAMPDPAAGTAVVLPEAAAEAAAALVAAALGPGATAAAPVAPAADPAGAVETLPAALPQEEVALVTPEEAERFYAATGVWIRAPRLTVTPRGEDPALLAVPGADAPPGERAATALPAAAPDARLGVQADPPPPGTRLPRDDRGFILATPDGTVTPDGLVIFAGAPPLVPPTRPGTVAPPAAATAEAVTAAALPPPGQPLTEPPATRPRARSPGFAEGLVPPGAGAPADAATGAPAAAAPGGVTLAGLAPPARPDGFESLVPASLPPFDGPRPRVRPAGLAPEGASSTPGDAVADPADPEAALAETLASIVEGAADPLASATPRAVAVASRPEGRPSNFARVVERQTERLARATAAVAREQSAGASLGTPEEAAETAAEEVEVAAAAPPASAPRNVAEAATMENVMTLREINLIGVYGTQSNRRALVRLESGRFVSVSVGDSLDGGRVAAIGDNELSYVRRGRNVTIEIPGQ